MLVTDRTLCGGEDALVEAVKAAVEGGVNVVQLREKDMPTERLIDLARKLREAASPRARLVVNGPLRVAEAAHADGLHLPEDAAPVDRPRTDFLIGRSVHSPEAAVRAQAEGADYVIAGPVYATRSHPGAQPAGLWLIEGVLRICTLPVLAIGGVTADRVPEVMATGASGVAVISAVLGTDDPADAARALRRALLDAWAERATAGRALR